MICTVYPWTVIWCFYISINLMLYIKKVIDMLNVSAPSRTPIFRGNRRDPGGLPMITNGGKQDKETGLTVWNEHYPFGKKLDNLTSSFHITSLSKCKWQLKYDRMKKITGQLSAIGEIFRLPYILHKLFLWHENKYMCNEKYCFGSWVIFCVIPTYVLYTCTSIRKLSRIQSFLGLHESLDFILDMIIESYSIW